MSHSNSRKSKRAASDQPGSEPKFPAWAPDPAIKIWREYHSRDFTLSDPRRECADMLVRLLTFPDMRKVWQVIASETPTYSNGAPGHLGIVSMASLFAGNAAGAYAGPVWREERLTQTQHAKWSRDVKVAADRLADLLRGTRLHDALRQDLTITDSEGYSYSPLALLQVLRRPANRGAANSISNRTTGVAARRKYFVIELTGFFVQFYGGPRRDLVVAATAAAFDDPSFTFSKRKLQTLAPVKG